MEIVKGNDISISWRIYRIVDGVKVPENLTTAIDFQTLVTANGLNVPITNSTISDTNLITILIKGRDQITGIYALEASWTSSLGEDSRVAYGKAFTVVDKQCQADYTLPEGLDVVSLEFYSSTHFGALYENLDVQKDDVAQQVEGALDGNALTFDSSINKWYGKPVKNYDRLDAWSDYSVGKEGWVLSAKLGKQLYDTKLNISAISEWALQPTFPGYTKEEIDAMIDSGGGSGDTFWELHPTEPNTIYTTYNVVSAGEISAYGVGSGGGGTVGALSELSDVQLTSLLSGDLLRYNGSHWINVPQTSVGTQVSWGGISSGYRQLSVAGTSYGLATDAHNHSISQVDGLQSALDNKWTTDSDKIANWDTAYTARHSHNNKDVLDQLNQNNVNVLSKLFLDNDGNLYTTENFYSEREISAYGYGGSGGGSGGAGALYELSDTSVDSRVTGDILIYNGTHWENRPQSSIVPDLTGYATEAWANNRFSLIGHTHNYIPLSQKGSPNGVAELDATGHIPSSQLPSYVDDVLEFATITNFPTTGETGKIYIALNTNLTYRWSGSGYVEISPSLALGETSSTAYRGDRGKIAYDHSQATGNPHNTTFAQLGSKPTTLSGYGITDAVTSTVFNDHKNNVNSEKHLTQAQLTNLINLSNWWKWDETNQAVYTEENVYSEKEISAYGAGSGGGGGAGALSELSDVNLTNPINTNLLQYNGSHWVNVPASSVGTPVSWGTTSNNTSPLTVSGVTKTVSLSGHLHAGVYEPVFSKNTAFNKNFGTTAGTVAEGNHTHGYLPLSGGTLTNNIGNILNLDTSGTDGSYIISKLNNVIKAYYGWYPTLGVFIQSGTAPNAAIGITDAQVPYFKTTSSGTVYNLWHAGNFNPANYLPLSGGTLTGNVTAPSFKGSIMTPSGVEYLSVGTNISAVGWYRVFVSSMNNAGGSSVILNVNRNYTYTNNESYTFSINVAYNGAISITQLSGVANARLISKIRVDYVNSGMLAVDIYYNLANFNTVYISGSGIGQFQAPSLVLEPTGTTIEFDTVNGVKSDLGFTGALTGNASSATKLQTARTLTVGNTGKTFDGTANVAWSLAEIGALPLTGGTMSNTNLVTNLNADLLDGVHLSGITGNHSNRDFINGTLITTNIDYSKSWGDPWVLEIKGNSYFDIIPFDIQYQGYIYNQTIINYGGISNGTNIAGLTVFNYNGNLTFWFPRQGYWQGFNVRVYTAYAGSVINKVTSIVDVAKPVDITKEVELSSGIKQSAYLTDNVASATKLQAARTIWGQPFDGTANVAGDLSGVGSVLPAATNYYSVGSQTNEFGNSYIRRMYTRHLDGTTSGGMNGDLYINYGESNNSTGRTFILGGNVGLGTIFPTAKLDVVVPDGASGTIKFQGTSGKLRIIPYYDATYGVVMDALTPSENTYVPMTLSGSKFVFIYGNVGIDTATPAAKLDVAGSAIIGITNKIKLQDFGGDFVSIQATLASDDNLKKNLVLNAWGGNVGIGTPNPQHYYHGGNNKVLEVYNPNTSLHSQAHVILSSGATTDASYLGTISWMTPNSTGNKGAAYISTLLTGDATTNASGHMIFATANENTPVERMRILNTGQVFIGTPSNVDFYDLLYTAGPFPGFRQELKRSSGGAATNLICVLGHKTSAIGDALLGQIGIMSSFGEEGISGAPVAEYMYFGTESTVSYFNNTLRLYPNKVAYFEGNVGIGTTSPSQKLHVGGNILATGEITAYVASDRRLKENIKPITSALECINKLNPVSYNWNARALELNSNKSTLLDYGLIAQEVENVLPGVVHGIFDDKYKSIDYIKLIPIMIAAIKELKQKVNKL